MLVTFLTFQSWCIQKPLVLACFPQPRRSRGWLRQIGRDILLAGEEQLGQQMGHEGIHYDGERP